jgi:hypothetical protein
MPNSLESLRILSNGPGGGRDFIDGRDNSQARLREMKRNLALAAGSGGRMTTGATGYDALDLEEQEANDPFFGEEEQARTAGVTKVNDAMGQYSRPDVTAQRNDDRGFQLEMRTAPARIAGEANIRAAQEAGNSRGLRDLLHMQTQKEDREALQGQRDTAAQDRLRQTGQNQANLAQIKELLKGRSNGFLGMGGNASDTDAKIAQLSGGGQQQSSGMVAMRTPDGRSIQVPADRVAEVEARGATRE